MVAGLPISGVSPATTVTRSYAQDFANTVYGRTIPLSAGLRAITGAPIWAGEIFKDSEAHFLGTGGSGGSSGSGTSGGNVLTSIPSGAVYTQPVDNTSVSFAAAFGYRLPPDDAGVDPLYVVKLWANDELIYDVTNPALTAQLPELTFVLYDGSETQLPDPTIKADKGDLTPAYRGMIYIVFNDFPSGKIPSFRAQAHKALPTIRCLFSDGLSDDPNFTEFELLEPEDDISGLWMSIDWRTGLWYGMSHTADATAHIHEFDIGREAELRRYDITPPSDHIGGLAMNVFYDHGLGLGFGTVGSFNSAPIFSFRIDTGEVVDEFGDNSSAVEPSDSSVPHARFIETIRASDSQGIHYGLAVASVLDDLCFFGLSTNGDLTFHNSQSISFGGPSADAMHNYPIFDYVSGGSAQDGTLFVGVNTNMLSYTYSMDGGQPIVSGGETVYTVASGEIQHIFTDPRDGNVVVFWQDSGLSWHALKLKTLRGTQYVNGTKRGAGQQVFFQSGSISPIMWEADLPTFNDTQSANQAIRNSNLIGGTFAFPTGGDIAILNLSSGAIATTPIPDELGTISYWLWDSTTNTMYIPPGIALGAGRVSATGESVILSNILEWLALRAGYLETEIEVDAGIDDVVRGVIVAEKFQTSTLFGAIAKVYQFSYAQAAGGIRFFKQSNANDGLYSIDTLTIDDLMAVSEGAASDNDALVTTFYPVDIQPFGVTIEYIDIDLDFEWSQQSFNYDTQVSGQELGSAQEKYRIPFVMTNNEAYSRATKLSGPVSELNVEQAFRVLPEKMRYEPGDVVVIYVNEFVYSVRIFEVVINADWSLSCLAQNFSFDQYVDVEETASSGSTTVPASVTQPLNQTLRPLALDVPLLYPGHDAGLSNSVLLLGAWVMNGVFPVTDIGFRRPEQGSYGATPIAMVTQVEDSLSIGIVSTTIGTTNVPFQIDDETELVVIGRSMTSSDLTSTDHDGMLSGLNAVLVGSAITGEWELVYFRDVAVSGSTYTLTGLLRGRRGTDYNAATRGINAGDTVILIASVAYDFVWPMMQMLMGVSQLDLYYYFTAVAEGATVGYDYPAFPNPDITIIGKSLMPWAPANIEAQALSGDHISITWNRRTRIEGLLHDDDGDIDLDEASEAYEIDVLDGPGGAVLRTITGITSESYTYTATDQATDGFTAPAAQLTLEVYQISANAGRGFTIERTVDVG